MEKKDKIMLRNILHLFKPFRKKIIVVIVCIILSSILSLLIPFINQLLIDKGLIEKKIQVIITYSIYNLILLSCIQGFGIVEVKYRAYIKNLLAFDLEKKAFKHILKLKLKVFSNTNYAEIISNLRTDINNISEIANENTFYILTSILRVIVGVIGLVLIDWRISILVIVSTPIRYLIVRYLTKKRRVLIAKYIESYKDYSKWYGDTIGGIKEVKLWGLETLKTSEFIKKQRNIIKENINIECIGKLNTISSTIFTEAITILIYIIGGYMIIGDSITIGKLFAFITYSGYVVQPIFAIMNIGYSFARVFPSAKRYFEFMDNDVEENKHKNKLMKINNDEIVGEIEFKDVKFAYDDKDMILNNINFKIKAGERVAIIGSNGSGKSTNVNLLLRFLDPYSGKIYLDGKDIKSLELRKYRTLLSVVSQDIYLFNTTIKENIILNSKKTNEDMYLAVEKSGANKFIEGFPNQYETIVGDRGSKLSGGQRQKIAMARAFLRDSKIIILDEATANYDMETELYVNDVIKNYYKDRTIIIITHKPAILEKVDKIIVINGGQVEDIGNHTELYKRNKFYREMVSK